MVCLTFLLSLTSCLLPSLVSLLSAACVRALADPAIQDLRAAACVRALAGSATQGLRAGRPPARLFVPPLLPVYM